jgi:hypothetical protein
LRQKQLNSVKRRTRAERDKDAEFEFIAKRSAPIAEAILGDEAKVAAIGKATPEEILAAFGPTDENCGEGVVDSNLPPAIVTDTQALEALDPGALTFELQAISRKPLTRMVVEEAREWDSKAKAYLDQAEKSEVRSKITDLFKQHKFWLGKFNAAVDPIKRGREAVSKLFAQWERKRIAEAAEQRRKDEAAALAAQEAARKADVAHLKVLGHVTEAKELAVAPLPPVVLPEPKNPPGKVEGVTVIPVWKLDPLNPVKDYRALYHYIADHPELWFHQELSPSRWKRTLTDAKGKTDIPGINVIETTETRNRG